MRLAGSALEDLAYATGDTLRLDSDNVVPEVECTLFGVIGDEDDAAGGGKSKGFGGQAGKEGLEGLHNKGEVWWRVWSWLWERGKDKLLGRW